jgi:chaperone LolA
MKTGLRVLPVTARLAPHGRPGVSSRALEPYLEEDPPMKPTPIRIAAAVATLLALGACDDDGKSDPSAPTATATATAPVPTAVDTAPSGAGGEDVLPPLPEEGPGGGTSADAKAPATAEPAPEPAPIAKAPPKTPEPKEPKGPEPKAPEPKTEPKPKTPEPTAKTPAPKIAPQPAPAQAKKLEEAKPGSADAVAEEIDKIFMPIKHFRARFDQRYTAKVHNTTKTSAGVLWVTKPDKLSLSYHEPNKNRAVSDGKILKVYEHENQQMFVKDVKNTEYPGAFAFIMGKGLRQSFTFEFWKDSKWEGGPVLIGTPRVPNPGYQRVFFYIDESLMKKGDLGVVRRVLVQDAQGNKNRFDFIHAEQPKSVPDDKFLFEPPKGTEIIKG